MYHSPSNPVVMRSLLLVIAVLLIVGSFLIGPGLPVCFAIPKGPIGLLFPAAMAFLAAYAASNFAYAILQGAGIPWYARPGGIVFLVVILACATAAFVFVDKTFLNGNSLAGVFPVSARVLQFSGMFLLWVLIMNWLGSYVRNDSGPEAYLPTQGFPSMQHKPGYPTRGGMQNMPGHMDSPGNDDIRF